MTGDVYISGIYQVGELGDKLGVRTKWRGEEWYPASFILPASSDYAYSNIKLAAQGRKLDRDQFPECEAVWNEQAFAKARDFLWLSGFLTVKQKVADVLSRFDLGGGELVPVPLYKDDLETPWPEPHYYINYGGPKDTFVPEESPDAKFQYNNPKTGLDVYEVPFGFKDNGVALNATSLRGADIWFEVKIDSKLFLSGALVDALLAAKIDVDLRLKACRIVEG